MNSAFNKAIKLHNVAITDGKNKEIELFSYKDIPHGLTSANLYMGILILRQKYLFKQKQWMKYGKLFVTPRWILLKWMWKGLEYDVVNGAGKLTKEICPLWLLEINYQTSEAFGWNPEQLMKLLKKMNNRYDFAKIHGAWGFLSKLRHSDELKNSDILVAFNSDKHKIF